MKTTPLIINWHDQNAPIYSAHFEPHGKGRLATAAGDNNVRLWKIQGEGENRSVEYLSTLTKHTQAVNVVRWAPRGELLASAGDDGNVILWVPSENHHTAFGSDGLVDEETWRAKNMCRSSGAEIYDLAWSPDGAYFLIGSMDNIARIYNAATGSLVRQIAEHSHYVQGVAWDPLNEFIATQSSDRSVHVYSLRTKDGQYTLANHDDKPSKVASHVKADLPPRRISSQSPAAPDMNYRSALAGVDAPPSFSMGSPVPSAPGTPTSIALPMNPPSVISHSRRSSFSSRRSVSPAPSMPLPAVMPMEASPKPHLTSSSLSYSGYKNASLYANETLASFFRRLTFTPDGALLLTPAGQYQTQHQHEGGKPTFEVVNTVYVYTRGGINKLPIAHLPGHKKPSVAVRCSPVFYTLRQTPPTTKHVTIDTSSAEEPIPALPEPLSKPSPAPSFMEPPPPPVTTDSAPSAKTPNPESAASASAPGVGPKPAFSLPYRMVYAVATQDAVLLYDTQQQTPICVVSNLHCATFTDLAWSSDGLTLLISSSDGFCSALSFSPGELGELYTGEVGPRKHSGPPSPFRPGPHRQYRSRSNSTSSAVTRDGIVSGPSLILGQVPGIAATNSGKVTGVPITTPPETPRNSSAVPATAPSGPKREASESGTEDGNAPKRRRIAPTLVPQGSTDGSEPKT